MEVIIEFESKAKEIQKRFEKEDSAKTIYHYRSAENALNIIKKQELWFANYQYLKREHDENEIDLGVKIILELIEIRKPEHHFWMYLYDQFKKINHSIYVLSCCYERDEKEVWKKYGMGGNGIALGFSFAEQDIKSLNPWEVFCVVKVLYNKIEFEKRINEFLDLAAICLDKAKDDETERNLAICLASHLLVYVPTLKEKKFDWEKEVRLVMNGLYGENGRRGPCELPIDRFRTLKNYSCSHFVQLFNGSDLTELCLNEKTVLKVQLQDKMGN